jgi:MerR family transcriptional regulator, light-induced transcriptional regulator
MTSANEKMLPIREVARLTGVNAVTLRAWERRYGLIEPHRTEKGHRLYTEANLEQVQTILTWLNRGVNVGQVKNLLDCTPTATDDTGEAPWGALRSRLLESLQRFDMRDFEQDLAVSRSRYAGHVVCEQLFEPILEQLQQRWQGQFGSQLEEVFFNGWLRLQVLGWTPPIPPSTPAGSVLVANLSPEHCEPAMWLLAALIAAEGANVASLEWEVPASELTLLLDHTPLKTVIFYSSQAIALHQLRRQLPKLARHLDGRLFIAGPAAAIHQDEWQALGIIALGTGPSAAYKHLTHRLRENQNG